MDPLDILSSTPGKTNFCRIARLLVSGGTSLLKEIFDARCLPSQLPTILGNPATEKLLKAARLTKPQWECLYPSPGVYGKSTDFDITLLTRLLRAICKLTPPSTGWDALPSKTDHTLTADLVRIKLFRNSIYAHNQRMEIADEEFPSLWQEISEVLVRIAGQFGHGKQQEWQKSIDTFLKEPLTKTDERNVEELQKWYENDLDVKKSLKDLTISTQEGMVHLEATFDRKFQEFAQRLEATVREELKDQVGKIQRATDDNSGPTATKAMDITSTKNKENGSEIGGQQDQLCFLNDSKTTPCTPVGDAVLANHRGGNFPLQIQGSDETDTLVGELEEKIKDTEHGTPFVRKLPVKEEMTLERSMISRQCIGQQARQSEEKVLLLVGATGAGKSSLVNGMANYILGVQWEDDVRFKLTRDDQQTNYITAYTIHPMDRSLVPYTFTVIDSPGFGGSESLRRDKEITGQIKKFFTIPPPEGIDHLDGIGFAIQASEARLTPTQQYIFDSILSIFGSDVSKNIFMFITFSDSQNPPVLDAIKKAEIPSQNEKLFKFNNSAIFAPNIAQEGISYEKNFWKMNTKSFEKFFFEFPKSECVSLRLTKKVLKEREQLYLSLESLSDQIKLGLDKIEEMRQEELVLQKHEQDIKANRQFTFEVTVTKPVHVSLEGTEQHTTTCIKCHSTCHKNCKIADDRKKIHCRAMGEEGKCIICGCIWSNHKNVRYLIEYEVFPETRTLESLRKKYLNAVDEKATAEQMMSKLAESLEDIHLQVLTKIKQARRSVDRLDEIALKPNSLTEVEHIEMLIESEKRSARPGWVQRLKYYQKARCHALLLSKVKDEEESGKLVRRLSRQVSDISEETMEKLENLSFGDENSDTWYSRFKF